MLQKNTNFFTNPICIRVCLCVCMCIYIYTHIQFKKTLFLLNTQHNQTDWVPFIPFLERQVLPGCLKLESGSHPGEEVPSVRLCMLTVCLQHPWAVGAICFSFKERNCSHQNCSYFLAQGVSRAKESFHTFSHYAVLNSKSTVFDFSSFSHQ